MPREQHSITDCRMKGTQMKKLITTILALAVACTFLLACSKAPDVSRLKDGAYSCSVTVNGGKENEVIQSPATINVVKGGPTAVIVWNTCNVEYMIVKGQRYDPINSSKQTAGGEAEKDYSRFVIPMDFDMDFPVSALNSDVDAENPIEYVLYFRSSTLDASDTTKRK